jgi:hypothetical protein
VYGKYYKGKCLAAPEIATDGQVRRNPAEKRFADLNKIIITVYLKRQERRNTDEANDRKEEKNEKEREGERRREKERERERKRKETKGGGEREYCNLRGLSTYFSRENVFTYDQNVVSVEAKLGCPRNSAAASNRSLPQGEI